MNVYMCIYIEIMSLNRLEQTQDFLISVSFSFSSSSSSSSPYYYT